MLAKFLTNASDILSWWRDNSSFKCYTLGPLCLWFSSRPSEVRLILKSPKCCTIQHKFVPARSVERNIEKIRFPWASNSKFVIFSQIFPRSNYKICPIIPRLFPVSNGDSPVSTTFPRSNYRGFFTTGESYCTMYTLCSEPPAGRTVHQEHKVYQGSSETKVHLQCITCSASLAVNYLWCMTCSASPAVQHLQWITCNALHLQSII